MSGPQSERCHLVNTYEVKAGIDVIAPVGNFLLIHCVMCAQLMNNL